MVIESYVTQIYIQPTFISLGAKECHCLWAVSSFTCQIRLFLVDGVDARLVEMLAEGKSSLLAHGTDHENSPNYAFILLSSCKVTGTITFGILWHFEQEFKTGTWKQNYLCHGPQVEKQHWVATFYLFLKDVLFCLQNPKEKKITTHIHLNIKQRSSLHA